MEHCDRAKRRRPVALVDLGTELLGLVCVQLDAASLIRVSATCKGLRAVVGDDRVWYHTVDPVWLQEGIERSAEVPGHGSWCSLVCEVGRHLSCLSDNWLFNSADATWSEVDRLVNQGALGAADYLLCHAIHAPAMHAQQAVARVRLAQLCWHHKRQLRRAARLVAQVLRSEPPSPGSSPVRLYQLVMGLQPGHSAKRVAAHYAWELLEAAYLMAGMPPLRTRPIAASNAQPVEGAGGPPEPELAAPRGAGGAALAGTEANSGVARVPLFCGTVVAEAEMRAAFQELLDEGGARVGTGGGDVFEPLGELAVVVKSLLCCHPNLHAAYFTVLHSLWREASALRASMADLQVAGAQAAQAADLLSTAALLLRLHEERALLPSMYEQVATQYEAMQQLQPAIHYLELAVQLHKEARDAGAVPGPEQLSDEASLCAKLWALRLAHDGALEKPTEQDPLLMHREWVAAAFNLACRAGSPLVLANLLLGIGRTLQGVASTYSRTLARAGKIASFCDLEPQEDGMFACVLTHEEERFLWTERSACVVYCLALWVLGQAGLMEGLEGAEVNMMKERVFGFNCTIANALLELPPQGEVPCWGVQGSVLPSGVSAEITPRASLVAQVVMLLADSLSGRGMESAALALYGRVVNMALDKKEPREQQLQGRINKDVLTLALEKQAVLLIGQRRFEESIPVLNHCMQHCRSTMSYGRNWHPHTRLGHAYGHLAHVVLETRRRKCDVKRVDGVDISYTRARALAGAAARIAKRQDDVAGRITALGTLGDICMVTASYGAAVKHYKESHELAIGSGRGTLEVLSLASLADAWLRLGQVDEARGAVQRVFALLRLQEPAPPGGTAVLGSAGSSSCGATALGIDGGAGSMSLAAAAAAAEAGEGKAQAAPAVVGPAGGCAGLMSVATEAQRALMQDIDNCPRVEAFVRALAVQVHLLDGQPAAAQAHLDRCMQLNLKDVTASYAYIKYWSGAILAARGDEAAAVTELSTAVELAVAQNDCHLEAITCAAHGLAALVQVGAGRTRAREREGSGLAMERFTRAIKLARAVGDIVPEARALEGVLQLATRCPAAVQPAYARTCRERLASLEARCGVTLRVHRALVRFTD